MGSQGQPNNSCLTHNAVSSSINLLPDSEINDLITSLNKKTKGIFETILKWSRTPDKNLSATEQVENPLLNLFITGGAGTGKSHLIKTVHAAVSKILSYGTTSVDKVSVLLLTPTCVAAVNVNGTTIHSALSILIDCRGYLFLSFLIRQDVSSN